MAKKRLIETAIWKDKWFRKLSRDAREIYLFLLTGPETLESGFIEIADDLLKAYLPNINNIAKARKELSPKVVFDPEHDLYLIPRFYEKNCKSYKMIKPALNDLEKYKTSSLSKLFCDKYNYIEEFKQMSDTLSIPYPDKVDTLSIGHSDNDNESDNESDNENKKRKDFDFESCYQLYPKHQGKARGMKKLQTQIKNEDDFLIFKKACGNYAAHCRNNETEEKYIKLFSTFCNDDWKDWIDTPKPRPQRQSLFAEGGIYNAEA